MSPESLFLICNYGVLPAWALLVLAPGAAWTQRLVHGVWIPLLLGAVYLGLLWGAPVAPAGASFSTLPGVMAFFAVPAFALAGWVHYLVFDLFVGAWQARDAQRRGLPHLWLLPCLLLTLLAGPLGLLAYLLIRFRAAAATSLEEEPPTSSVT